MKITYQYVFVLLLSLFLLLFFNYTYSINGYDLISVIMFIISVAILGYTFKRYEKASVYTMYAVSFGAMFLSMIMLTYIMITGHVVALYEPNPLVSFLEVLLLGYSSYVLFREVLK